MTVFVKHRALRFLSAFALTILISAFAARPVFAACSNPTGAEHDIIYNGDFHTYQACNGTGWTSLGGTVTGGGGGGCSNPAGVERDWNYNTDFHTYQFCNGTAWVRFSRAASSGPPAGSGFFVLSKSTWTGNLGGSFAAADAKCLTELTTNTGWRGYATASANGQLVAAKVHAFLCSAGGSCNNLNASTTYYFANAANSSLGGASFTTDGTNQGPNDSADWGAVSYFGGEYLYWSDRGYNTATAWSTGNWTSTGACYTTTDWDTGTNAKNGAPDNTHFDPLAFNGGQYRWYDGYTIPCNNTEHLICYVNP